MDPVREDLTWRRNAPEPVTYTFVDDDGSPFNLTGYSFALQVRRYPGAAGAPLVSLGMAAVGAPGFHLDDAVGGKFTCTPPAPAALDLLPPPPDLASGVRGDLVHETLLIHPDGYPEPFMEGNIILQAGVVRL